MKTHFVPPKCELKVQTAVRNGVIFELHGTRSSITLSVWRAGEWQPVSTVRNDAAGWRLLDDVMNVCAEKQLVEETA